MILNIAMWMLAAAALPAAHAQDCSAWGTIEPGADPDALFIGESYRFYVGDGGGACGDTSLCEWNLDEANAVGRLQQSVGSPALYQAPEMIDGCTPVSFLLFLLCDGTGGDSINMTVQCTAEAKQDLLMAPGSTVAGGGCTDPGSVAIVLPLVITSLRRRKYPDGKDT